MVPWLVMLARESEKEPGSSQIERFDRMLMLVMFAAYQIFMKQSLVDNGVEQCRLREKGQQGPARFETNVGSGA